MENFLGNNFLKIKKKEKLLMEKCLFFIEKFVCGNTKKLLRKFLF